MRTTGLSMVGWLKDQASGVVRRNNGWCVVKHLLSPSFSPGLHHNKAAFDHAIIVQGVLFNNNAKSTIYQTAQSRERGRATGCAGSSGA